MEIRNLLSFVHTAESGSVSKAAYTLNMTQGAVSQQIRQLEEELGVKLFVRTRKEMRLTDIGNAFIVRARNILREMNDGREEVASMNRRRCGELNIGIGSFIEPLLGRAIGEFMKRYPEVRVRCQYDYASVLNRLLRNHELDIAFSMNEAYDNEGIISKPCLEFNIYAIMRNDHPLARKDKITKDDLLKYRLILPDTGKREIDTMAKYADFDVREIVSASCGDSNNANALLNAVSYTNVITFLPKDYVLHRENLVARKVAGLEKRLASNSHVMADTPVKASVRRLLELIKEYGDGYVQKI